MDFKTFVCKVYRFATRHGSVCILKWASSTLYQMNNIEALETGVKKGHLAVVQFLLPTLPGNAYSLKLNVLVVKAAELNHNEIAK